MLVTSSKQESWKHVKNVITIEKFSSLFKLYKIIFFNNIKKRIFKAKPLLKLFVTVDEITFALLQLQLNYIN